jgi:hypothetical protein
MITRQTATDIWCAYDEIQKAQKLIEDMEKVIKEYRDPNPRDAFGRPRNLSLGVPSGENSQRLFDVQPKLAISIMKAHIAEKEAVLVAANERAKVEADVDMNAPIKPEQF